MTDSLSITFILLSSALSFLFDDPDDLMLYSARSLPAVYLFSFPPCFQLVISNLCSEPRDGVKNLLKLALMSSSQVLTDSYGRELNHVIAISRKENGNN